MAGAQIARAENTPVPQTFAQVGKGIRPQKGDVQAIGAATRGDEWPVGVILRVDGEKHGGAMLLREGRQPLDPVDLQALLPGGEPQAHGRDIARGACRRERVGERVRVVDGRRDQVEARRARHRQYPVGRPCGPDPFYNRGPSTGQATVRPPCARR